MSELFSKYKIMVLDSSFFTSPFSRDVKEGIAGLKVYVAASFNSELEQYRMFLSGSKLEVFNANLAFLKASKNVVAFDMKTGGDKTGDLQNDIWGLITFLVRMKADNRFVVVTANQILMQRMILNDIPADIFDLNTNSFRSSSEFAGEKEKYELRSLGAVMKSPDDAAREGTILYKTDGNRIVLGSEFHSGLEGVWYRVGGSDRVIAKIFNNGELSADKFCNLKNIAGINRRYDMPFATFPDDLLYYDPEQTIPAGFIEDYVCAGNNLGECSLDRNGPAGRSGADLNTRRSENIELCQRIVRQICYLNVFGFYISDFNYSNFSLPSPEAPHVHMWNVDGFGYGRYFSNIDAGYRLSRSYDLSSKRGVIESCYDELYVFVFSVLTLGDWPISEKDGVFKYSLKEYASSSIAQSRKSMIPSELWEHFSEVFSRKKPPSAEALLDQLTAALKDLQANPEKDRTYYEIVNIDRGDEEQEMTREEVKKLIQEQTPVMAQRQNKMLLWIAVVAVLLGIASLVTSFVMAKQSSSGAIDSMPRANSSNPVTSGGVYAYGNPTILYKGKVTEGTITLSDSLANYRSILFVFQTNVDYSTEFWVTSQFTKNITHSMYAGSWDSTRNAFQYNSWCGLERLNDRSIAVTCGYNNANWVAGLAYVIGYK